MKGLGSLSKLSESEKDALILKQHQQLLELSERIKDLESRLSKNSQNSSKPPSSDGLNKPAPRSQRKKSGKSPGGQLGHKGVTLKFSDKVDHKEVHKVTECEHCGENLEGVEAEDYEARQVYEIPPIEIEITEHRGEIKHCEGCGEKSRGIFPEGVSQRVQYGPYLKGLASYMNGYQLLPYDRLGEFFKDVMGHHLSVGSLVNAQEKCHKKLEGVELQIKESLKDGDLLHLDESGMRVKGKLHWGHVASNESLTYYGIHERRGQEAMDGMGILGEFSGRAIHDHWRAYFSYEGMEHGLCNAHHLRELEFVGERFSQDWAFEMKRQLVKIKEEVEEAKEKEKEISKKRLRYWEEIYDQILAKGFEINPDSPKIAGKRGRKKQSKAKNLLDRLRDYKAEVLAFMHDVKVPFDNNLAERDLRMLKVKQKISGCFRSTRGAERFCRIRGYISTMRKNSINVLDALTSAFQGRPLLPPCLEG